MSGTNLDNTTDLFYVKSGGRGPDINIGSKVKKLTVI